MQELVGGASMIAGYRVVKRLGTSKRFEAYRVAMAPPVAGFGTLYLMRDALVQEEPFVKMVNAIRAAWPFDMPSSRQVVLPEARVWENRPWFIVPEGLPVLSSTQSSSPSAVASLRAQLDWLHDFQLPGEEGQFAHGDVRASRIALVAGVPFLIAPGWVAACELASGRSLAHTRADDAYHLAKLLVQRLEAVNEAPMARGEPSAIETPRPARPVERVRPVERAKPEPAKPVARARAVEPERPAERAKPKPVERVRPAEAQRPVERARPAEAQPSVERARAVEPERPPAVAARAPARPPPPRVAAPLQPPPADLLAEVGEELLDVPSDVPPAEVTPQASPVAAAPPPPWPAAAPPLPAAPQAPPPWPAAAPEAPPLPAAAAAPAPWPADVPPLPAAPQAPPPWPAAAPPLPAAPQAPPPWPAAAPPLPAAPQASAAPQAVAAPASPAVSPSTQAGAQPSGGGSLRWLWVVAAFVMGLLLVFAVLFFMRR